MTTQTDTKYRILVLLQRSDRPDFFSFHCPRCNMKVADLANGQMVGMTDVIDFDSRFNLGIGVPHRGRLGDGNGFCSIIYYFTLGETGE